MTTGIKTYNDSINIDPAGRSSADDRASASRARLRDWRRHERSIQPCHTRLCVCTQRWRDDYQDITRDLVGQPSISHPDAPLPGVDVLLGGGWGEKVEKDDAQGKNFVPGNKYIAPGDLAAIDAEHGGKYLIAQRTKGQNGEKVSRGRPPKP